MNIVIGAAVSMEVIEGWIKQVNEEFGLTDKNQACLQHFAALKNYYIFIVESDFYAVLEPSVDIWGTREMHVVSYYIKPDKRNIRLFLKIQHKFEEISKAWDCKFLYQGSHLGDRLYSYLERNGYKVATMRKEIK